MLKLTLNKGQGVEIEGQRVHVPSSPGTSWVTVRGRRVRLVVYAVQAGGRVRVGVDAPGLRVRRG